MTKALSTATTLATGLLSIMLFGGCSAQPEVASSSNTPPAPPQIEELTREQAVSKATSAFKVFGEELKGELQEALAKGGPVNAVKVCHDIAPQLAAQTSEREGFVMGRSSHRLRNGGNAPSEAIADYLQKHAQAGDKAPIEALKDGNSWVVVAPILTQPLCLTCHGDPATFSPELKKALSETYPEDKATGFATGDLRGVFWARLP